MNAHAPATFPELHPEVPLGPLERAERKLGRTGWTYADYVAEGRLDFDAAGLKPARVSPFRPADREHWAKCFADMHCPLHKRGKQRFGGAF